jgi:hypothetical protein
MDSLKSTLKSEERLAQTYDRCLSNTLLNTSKALLVGIAFSAIAFRRKTWPIGKLFASYIVNSPIDWGWIRSIVFRLSSVFKMCVLIDI